MKRGKAAASLLLALTLVLSYAAVPVFAAGETGDTEKESIPQGNQTEGSWVYEVAESAMGGPGGGGPGGGGPAAVAPAAVAAAVANPPRRSWTPLWP